PDDGPALPLFGALFRRKRASPADGAGPAAGTTPEHAQKKKKRLADTQRLSFGAADDDDSDDDGSAHAGAARPASKGAVPPRSQLHRLAMSAAAEAPARQPSATARMRCHDSRPPLPGFVLLAPVEPASHASAGLSVPSTFTGVRRRPASRWDAVPASGSQSRLAAHGTSGAGSGGPALVTANDRAQLGVMDAPQKQPAPPAPHAAVDPKAAQAALGGFMPYATDAAKQARYRAYLEQCAARGSVDAAASASEADEFSQMARMFKPNAAMLSRFAAAGAAPYTDGSGSSAGQRHSRPHTKNVVRTVREWAPHPLLCKRMGVAAPANAVPLKKEPAQEPDRPQRMRAADFIQLDTTAGTTPLVMAGEIHDEAPAAKRPDLALFRSIFGDDD
ncbi:hypothetical protein H4R21_006593, partial [Coemansia helicoidea]